MSLVFDLGLRECHSSVISARDLTPLAHDVDIGLDISLRDLKPNALAGLRIVSGRQNRLELLLQAKDQVIMEPVKPAWTLEIRIHAGKW